MSAIARKNFLQKALVLLKVLSLCLADSRYRRTGIESVAARVSASG